MRRITSLLAWFALLEGLWALFVGTRQGTELAAGLIAAAVGAVFAELLRTKGLLAFTTHFGLLGKGWKLVWLVPFDFLLGTWEVLRAVGGRRRIRGEWLSVPFPVEEGSRGEWQRAFGVAASNGALNAIVVDLDEGQALLHVLRPDVFSGRTVL